MGYPYTYQTPQNLVDRTESQKSAVKTFSAGLRQIHEREGHRYDDGDMARLRKFCQDMQKEFGEFETIINSDLYKRHEEQEQRKSEKIIRDEKFEQKRTNSAQISLYDSEPDQEPQPRP
jgi:transposase InsO family protein